MSDNTGRRDLQPGPPSITTVSGSTQWTAGEIAGIQIGDVVVPSCHVVDSVLVPTAYLKSWAAYLRNIGRAVADGYAADMEKLIAAHSAKGQAT